MKGGVDALRRQGFHSPAMGERGTRLVQPIHRDLLCELAGATLSTLGTMDIGVVPASGGGTSSTWVRSRVPTDLNEGSSLRLSLLGEGQGVVEGAFLGGG